MAWISGSLGFVAQGCIFGEMKVARIDGLKGTGHRNKRTCVGNSYIFYFILTHIFHMGWWKTHQLDNVLLVDFTLQCSCCSTFCKREVHAGARHHTWFYMWLRHLGPEQPCRGWKNSWQMEGLRNFKVILGIDITPLIQLLYFSCQNESLLFNNFCKKLWGSICFGRSRGCVSV